MEKISKKKTGAKIKEEMEKRGMTVRDLQDILSLESPQAVYKWLNGRALPSLENMLVLGRLFQMPLEQLLIQENGVPASHRPFQMDLASHCLVIQELVLASSASRMRSLQRQLMRTGRMNLAETPSPKAPCN